MIDIYQKIDRSLYSELKKMLKNILKLEFLYFTWPRKPLRELKSDPFQKDG